MATDGVRSRLEKPLNIAMAYLLRLILISSLFCVGSLLVSRSELSEALDWDTIFPVSVAIPLLQILSVFFNFPYAQWVGILLLSGEVVAMFLAGTYLLLPNAWSSAPYIFASTTIYVLLGLLMLMFVAQFVNCLLFWRRRYTIFDIQEGEETGNGDGSARWGQIKSKYGSRFVIIFGNHLWKRYLGLNAVWVYTLRALVAITIVIFLVGYSILVIILEPLLEGAATPTKELHSFDFSENLGASPVVWGVIVSMNLDSPFANEAALTSAVGVIPISSTAGSCEHVEYLEIASEGYTDSLGLPSLATIKFLCPNINYNANTFALTELTTVAPDLLVLVNFTQLGINANTSANVSVRQQAVSVLLALSNDTETVLAHAQPVDLIPGVNLLGGVTAHFRTLFTEPPLSAFGGFAARSRTFLEAEITRVIPDSAPWVPRQADITTMRLYMSTDWSDWKFIQDYREKSIWAGVSVIGGLWASLDGVFALLFGTTLAFVMFGWKQIPVFGIFHPDSLRRKAIQKAEKPSEERQGEIMKVLDEAIISLDY